MRQRWFGATRLRVPEIAVEGEEIELPDEAHASLAGVLYEALVLRDVSDERRLERAHADGLPVVVRAASAEEVHAALRRPEVACVAVPPSARELRELDLTELTYG